MPIWIQISDVYITCIDGSSIGNYVIDRCQKISIGVFIDLKKAFDTVNHTLLIDKLEYYGIRGIAQEWLKSYLKYRKQFVQIDECASTLLNVTCGVPQGSILGPKLFILYINDICNASTSLKFILFADDTNAFYSGVDIQTICECISRELDKLHVWLSVNKRSQNVDKTNFILFGNRKNIDNVCISMNNSIITRVRATKFLGVIRIRIRIRHIYSVISDPGDLC